MPTQKIGLCLCAVFLLFACDALEGPKVDQRNPNQSQAADAVSATQAAIIPAAQENAETINNLPPAATNLQAEALEILNRSCGGCHSSGNAQGNFGIIANIEAMIASGRYLAPGEPGKSLLITKLAPTGNMPPSGTLKPEEITLLRNWVTGLKSTSFQALSEADVLAAIRRDVEVNVPSAFKTSTRYFSLSVPQNLGATPETLNTLRKSFVKVLNSLSKAPALVVVKAIDEARLIYRVQLTDLAMSTALFDKVMTSYYPFAQNFIAVANDAKASRAASDHVFLKSELGVDRYLLRMDWFAATMTLPQPYAELLQLGADQNALQQQLGVPLIQNIIDNKVVRSGFKNSNVSSQNRIIERHTQSNGLSYWVSYDFQVNEGTNNIFSLPLGPVGIGQDAKAFAHAGGEMIFQLPNGLFAYYLSDATGQSIDKGPTSIVKQVDAPPQFLSAIVNGISCMNCHGAGLLYKKDEIRDFALNNANIFNSIELEKVNLLYSEERNFKASFDKDNFLYFKSLKELGVDPTQPDPVSQAFRYYNRGMGRADVREELGVTDVDLNRLLVIDPFRSQWSSLGTNQGFIKREEFNLLVDQALEQVKRSVIPLDPTVGDMLVTPACMFSNALSTAACLIRKPALPVVSIP